MGFKSELAGLSKKDVEGILSMMKNIEATGIPDHGPAKYLLWLYNKNFVTHLLLLQLTDKGKKFMSSLTSGGVK